MPQIFRRADQALLTVEKAVCVILIALMSGAVFVDVIHRLASGSGPFEAVPGMNLALGLLLSTVMLYAALRTAKTARTLAPTKALLWATGLSVTGSGLIRGMLWAFPNGFVGSQTFALCGMLWVGFLGASIATHDGSHLTLEITEFLWRGKAKEWVGRIGTLGAAVFCAVLAWLCWLYVRYQFAEWADSEGISGTFDGFPAPRFVVFAILPWVFATMTLRFVGRTFFPREAPPPPIKPIDIEPAMEVR
jgi:TRAP-type C4-dicarboxylate transport system permease small subunit